MRILHYFLGFPPYRTGGLTKFAFDLMQSQVDNGDYVVALWPGVMTFLGSETKIKKHKKKSGINSYELVNPLPIPLDEGIIDIENYTKSVDLKIYTDFLLDVKPDVIHIHTLMGLHKEFIDAAKKHSIKIIFTTHDYFGICPKVTLFKNGKPCDNDKNCAECVNCNKSALSLKQIMLLQSPFYRGLKDSFLIKFLRKKHRGSFDKFICEVDSEMTIVSFEEAEKYQKLREFYLYMLYQMDLIHFNSSLSEKVYKKYLDISNSIVLPISNKEINGSNAIQKTISEKLRISYLAPPKRFKGYYDLIDVLDKVEEGNKGKFELNIFSKVPEKKDYMNVRENGFCRDELNDIFANTDILVTPSVCYETFGFTVLEALNYNTKVIVSENVGAKDIIGDMGIVVSNDNLSEELYKTIIDFIKNREKITVDNNEKRLYYTWDEYVQKNYLLYK